MTKASLFPLTYRNEVKLNPSTGKWVPTAKMKKALNNHITHHSEQMNGGTIYRNLETDYVVFAPKGHKPEEAQPGHYEKLFSIHKRQQPSSPLKA